jgi:fructoselysine 6-phosphate deglycase
MKGFYMNQTDKYIEKAIQSDLFTAPILGPDLERFLREKGDFIKLLAKQYVDEEIEHIYWVGAGNSWTNLFSGKYLLDMFTDSTSDCYNSYDFIWRNPKRLNKKAWVFLASFKGATEDTIAATRFANDRGARTIVLVNKADSLMGKEGNCVIDYNSKALYILPLAAVYLFSLEVARIKGTAGVEAIINNLYQLPSFLSKQFVSEKEKAKKHAENFLNQDLIYTLGSGPLYGLAYKFGLTVFMENMRINGSVMDASEMRHGPVEMLARYKPAFVLLLGTDESRTVVERVKTLIESNGAPLLSFDMADYPGIHPLLAPFALMIPLQWFAVYSAILRGITDLDERVFMGRGIIGIGDGIKWP